MLRGKIPFRDTFPVHGLLADGGLDYLLFRIFPPSLRASVLLHQILGTLFQPAIFLVAAAATRRPLLCLALTPVTIGIAPGYVFDRAVLPLISLALFLFAIDPARRRILAGLSGALAALGILYALEFGIFVLLAEVVALALARLRPSSRSVVPARPFLAGLALAAVAACLLLAWQGALIPFLKVSFVDLPSKIGRVWGLRFPGPSTLVRAWSEGAAIPGLGAVGFVLALRLYLIPIAVVVAAAALAVAWRRAPDADLIRTIAIALACALWFRYLAARFHYESGNALVGPTLIAAVALIGSSRPSARRIVAATGVLAALALGLAFGGFRDSWGLLRNAAGIEARLRECPNCIPFDEPRGGGIRVPADELAELRSLREAVGRYAGEGTFLDLSNRPGLYFFLDRVNPTRFYQVPLMEPFQDEVISDLIRRPPRCVLIASGTPADSPDGRRNSDRIPRIWAFVEERYPRRVETSGNVFALPPASDPIPEAATTRRKRR